eukprot:scaffold4097_cov166-Amphora_coffeaeformis.AAC.2
MTGVNNKIALYKPNDSLCSGCCTSDCLRRLGATYEISLSQNADVFRCLRRVYAARDYGTIDTPSRRNANRCRNEI